MPRSSAVQEAHGSRSTYEVFSAGCDWLTATATGLALQVQLGRYGELCQRHLIAEGHEPRPWKWKGYEGSQVGGVIVGERWDSVYVNLSSDSAYRWWRGPVRIGANITRWDGQVTISGVPAHTNLVDEGWAALGSPGGDNGNVRSWQRINTRPTGDTLYIGATSSAGRCRLYDKHAEDPEHYPAGAWRYELQARARLARAIATGLDLRPEPSLAILSLVHDRFSTAGVSPRFRPGSDSLRVSVPRARTDDERRLRWLREQVRATVRTLASHGRRADALAALGLELADDPPKDDRP